MGFGGSTAAANQSLKANRAMLGKRRKGKLSLAMDNPAPWTDPKSATPSQLKEIKTRIQKQERRRFKLTVGLVFVGLAILVLGYVLLAMQL